MRQIVRVESIKTLSCTSFHVVIGLHFILFLMVVLIASRLNITLPEFSTEHLFRFPHVWGFFSWIASWFNILLAIMIIFMTCNEYAFGTFRQQVISGLSRNQLLGGKGFLILCTALYGFLLVATCGFVFGFFFSGRADLSQPFAEFRIVLLYFVQAMAYMSAGLFFAILFRSSGLSITLFVLYRLIIEPVFRHFFPRHIRPFFPMKAISSLTPTPEFLSITSGESTLDLREMGVLPRELPIYINLLMALIYLAAFVYFSGLILRKRDL